MDVQFASMPTVKIKVDQECVWTDMIAFYKGKWCMQANVRIQLQNQPGGVRRQVYTQVYTTMNTSNFLMGQAIIYGQLVQFWAA